MIVLKGISKTYGAVTAVRPGKSIFISPIFFYNKFWRQISITYGLCHFLNKIVILSIAK
jgi:hypothetical protein